MVEIIAEALESQALMEHKPVAGLFPEGPRPFFEELDESIRKQQSPEVVRHWTDLSSLLPAIAHRSEIDTSDRFWKLKVLVRLILEHTHLNGPPPVGKKGRTGPYLEADKYEMWIRANQLRAVLMVRLDGVVSEADLTHEMARRELGLGTEVSRWTEAQVDKHLSTSDYLSRTLAEARRSVESSLLAHNFRLPSMRRNSKHSAPEQGETIPFKWAPSDRELKECPGWQAHMKELRTQHIEKLKRRQSSRRSERP